jgi:cytoskeleton protein RodZ
MADIGSTLHDGRMRARIDIGEVEASTQIRARYLRALENEDWDMLPGPVYVKSFLRTYGDFLGLDGRALVEEFKRRYERPGEFELRSLTSLGAERPRPRRGRRAPAWALIVALVVAVAAGLWVLGKSGKVSHSSRQAASAPRLHRPGSAPAHQAPLRPAPPTRVTLQLVPTAPVYVCLVDANGKTLIPGVIFTPGERIPTKTAGEMKLTLGNAGVSMKVNGKRVGVAPSATSIGLLLSPDGVLALPVSQQPQCQ